MRRRGSGGTCFAKRTVADRATLNPLLAALREFASILEMPEIFDQVNALLKRLQKPVRVRKK